MPKKDFKATNPALSFISAAGSEQEQTEQTAPATRTKAPAGYKLNPMYVETKSKRVQLLMQPSIAEAIKALAHDKGISMNEAIAEAVKEYIERNKSE